MPCGKQAAAESGMWRDLLQIKQEPVLLMSFSSSALAHRQVGGLLKLCRLLRHLGGSCTHQLNCSLCGYIWPLQILGVIRRGQLREHGTHGLATWVFAPCSANIFHQTWCWGSCIFSGVWGLLPHPLLVAMPMEEQSLLHLSAAGSPHLSCHLLWAGISALLCSRTWLGHLGLPFLFRLIFQQMSPGKKKKK